MHGGMETRKHLEINANRTKQNQYRTTCRFSDILGILYDQSKRLLTSPGHVSSGTSPTICFLSLLLQFRSIENFHILRYPYKLVQHSVMNHTSVAYDYAYKPLNI